MSYRYISKDYKNGDISRLLNETDIEVIGAFSAEDCDNLFKLSKLSNNEKINITFRYCASSLFNEHETNINDVKNLSMLSAMSPNLNIVVNEGSQGYTLEDAFWAEQKVFDVAQALNKDENLSKYTKFLSAYSYVISKAYKSDNNRHDKNFFGAMTTDSIVCEGYAKLLKKFCSYLDIECKVIIGEDITDNHDPRNRHALCYVKFKDEKYNIDGAFLSDPTWDATSAKEGEKSYEYALFPIQDVLDKNSKHSVYFHKGCGDSIETHGDYWGCTLPSNSSPKIDKSCLDDALKHIRPISLDDGTEKTTKPSKKEEKFIM